MEAIDRSAEYIENDYVLGYYNIDNVTISSVLTHHKCCISEFSH